MISENISKYIASYAITHKKIGSSQVAEKRRLLGVHALVDSKQSPIVKEKSG